MAAEAGVPSAETETSQRNLGDVLLGHYARFLREYDENVARVQDLTRQSRGFMQDFVDGHFGVLEVLAGDDLGEFDLGEIRNPEFNPASKEMAMAATITGGMAKVVESKRSTRFDLRSLNRQGGRPDEWPEGEVARVTDLSEGNLHIRKMKSTSRGMVYSRRWKHEVEGRIVRISLPTPQGFGGDGSLRIEGSFGREYDASSLIDTHRGYIPTVKIDFL